LYLWLEVSREMEFGHEKIACKQVLSACTYNSNTDEEGDIMPRILVVDDDPDVVEACRLVLEKEGYDVSEASNRVDGMVQFAEVKPDLIILDVMMDQPDDGIVMAQQLRYKGSKIPILMLTSVNKVIGLELGPDDKVVPVAVFCEKPIEPATLINKVAELLSQRGTL